MIHGHLLFSEGLLAVVAISLGNKILPPTGHAQLAGLGFFASRVLFGGRKRHTPRGVSKVSKAVSKLPQPVEKMNLKQARRATELHKIGNRCQKNEKL
jgi:hypothetical protein